VEATVTYLQHQQHMSYERTQATRQELFGLTLSAGGQACTIERAGAAAAVEAETIWDAVRQSAVVGSDETGTRLNGHNEWQWVFRSGQAAYHVIRHRRGLDVIAEVMGAHRSQTWVCDCWAPQLRAPPERLQLCLAHQIRNLQGLIERCPRLAWARELQALFREAIHLVKRRADLPVRALHGG
jgi:transposase